MNIFICDDEDIYIRQLTDLLTKYFDENKIKNFNFFSFSKGEDLLKSEIQPDLAFLDIEMGTGLSGTHVGKKLQDRYPNIKIFIVTSHIEYVNEAFRFSFFRYILKPIEKHTLFRNVSDAFYQQKVELKEVHIDIKRDKDDRDSSEETITVPVRDVVAITVDNRGTRIFLTNRTVNSNQTISHFDKQLLGSSFFRTHRDFLVNIRYVTSFTDFNATLTYNSGTKIFAYLSKAKRKTFKEAFLWYKERIYEYL